MKSKKWTLLATSLTAVILMTACAQSTTKSGSNTTTTNSATTTTSTKTNQSSYFTDKDYDTSYDESTASKIELSGSSANVSGDGGDSLWINSDHHKIWNLCDFRSV